MKRVILLVVGWMTALGLFGCGIGMLEIGWNLFDFSPHLNLGTIGVALVVTGALVAVWFLAKASRDRVTLVVSILACGALALLGILCLPAEQVDTKRFLFFGRTQPSPLWFRAGRAALLCLPGIICLWWRLIRRYFAHQTDGPNRSPSEGSR